MRKSLTAIILFAFIFSGCSKLKLAFNFLPWMLERQAKKYVGDLNSEQSAKLEAEVKEYVSWLRSDMMPTYSIALRLLADGLGSTTTSKAAELLAPAAMNGIYAATVEPLYRPSAELLLSLDEKQLKDLEASLKKRTDEDRKNYLDETKLPFETRMKRLQKGVEDWFGPLEKDQVTQLRGLAADFPMPYDAWIKDREERAAELLLMLREKKARREIEAHLRDWWTKARAASRRKEDYQWDDTQLKKFTLGLLNMLNTKQKSYCASTLLGYASQIDEIATIQPEPQPKPTAPAN